MKIHFTLILLIILKVSFSQNKKKQIEYLNLKLDSLNYVIEQERKIFSNQMDVLKQNLQKVNDSSTKKITELTRELTDAKSQLEYLKNDQKIKKQEISKQKNKIQKLNDSISKLNTILKDSKMNEIDFPNHLIGGYWAINCQTEVMDNLRVSFSDEIIIKEYEGEVKVTNIHFYENGGEIVRVESDDNRKKYKIYYLSYPENGGELLLFEFKLIDGKLICGEDEYKQELIFCD